jgi:hypothetical protein
MRVKFERDGTSAVASADGQNRLKEFSVEVRAAAVGIYVKPIVQNDCFWEMSAKGGVLPVRQYADFRSLWGDIPTSVTAIDGTVYPVFAVIAEIVDAQGKVSAPGHGISAERQRCRRALDRYTSKFTNRELVEVLRIALAKHGYTAEPNLKLVQGLGECVAFHEMAGAIHDRHLASRQIDLEGLIAARSEFEALQKAVWGPK